MNEASIIQKFLHTNFILYLVPNNGENGNRAVIFNYCTYVSLIYWSPELNNGSQIIAQIDFKLL